MTYYIKGGSRYNEANPTVWTALNLAGFPDAKYLDADWKEIGFEGIIDSQDPFWLMGSTSGGAKEFEFGLYSDNRIKITTTGYEYWDGDSWENLIGAGGGAIQLSGLSDVGTVLYTAGFVLRADGDNYETGYLQWGDIANKPTEFTPTAHVLATTGPHTGTLPWTDLNKTGSNLTDLATRQHAGLTDITSDQHHTQIHYHNTETLQHDGVNSDGGAFSFNTTGTVSFNQAVSILKEIILTEIAEPATPAATKLKLWAEESQGHTVLRFAESSGAHIHTIGECMHVIGRNTSGAEIAKGKLVYYNGTTTGKHPNFSMAKADALATMPVIGITTEAVANNGYGKIMTMGRLIGLNTDAFLAGDILYVSGTAAGGMTKTFPPSPLLDQQIGIVEVKHATTGIILVDVRTVQGRNDGTIRQSFQIGDGASGDVTLAFNGDANNDGSLIWDVSEDQFVFNYDVSVPNLITAGDVDGVDVSTLKTDYDAHLHDGDVLQLDGIDSDGGIFEFIASNTIRLKPSGDLDDYISFSTVDGEPIMSFTGGDGKIENVKNPANNQDAATKIYHDNNKTVAGDLNHDDIANPQGNANEQHLTAAEVAQLHDDVITTNAHADARIAAANHDVLQNPNGNANEQHLTAAEVAQLHDDVIKTVLNVEAVITAELQDGQSINNSIDGYINAHAGDDDAHHAVFVPGDEDAAIAAHAGDDDAHHEVVTTAEVTAAITGLIATHHAALSADHDDRYYTETEVDDAVATKDTKEEAHAYVEATALIMENDITFNAGQTFDGIDVSELPTTAEVTAAINGLIAIHHAALSADHDDRYYTEDEIDAMDIHPQAHDLASHTTKAHQELTDYNAEANVKHLTDAQVGDLHAIYTLEVHDNDEHNPNYSAEGHEHVEADITDLDHLTDAEAVQAVEDAGLILSASKTINIDGTPADATYTGNAIDINTDGCATYDAVYIDGVNSCLPAKADSMDTMPAIGIVVAPNKVLILGTVRSDATFVLAADKVVYVSEDAAGDLKDAIPGSVGDIVQTVGYTVGTDMLYVNPAIVWGVRK